MLSTLLAYVGDGDVSLILILVALIALAAAVYFAVARPRRIEAALVCLLIGVVILILASASTLSASSSATDATSTYAWRNAGAAPSSPRSHAIVASTTARTRSRNTSKVRARRPSASCCNRVSSARVRSRRRGTAPA